MRVKAKNTLHWRARKGKTGVEKKILLAGHIGDMDEATAKSFISAGAAEQVEAEEKAVQDPKPKTKTEPKTANEDGDKTNPETEQADDKDVL